MVDEVSSDRSNTGEENWDIEKNLYELIQDCTDKNIK